ncbi:hypothetical protein LSUE1_G001987 [Lachnellula suecica]|uniref:Uncharacterized protein n=1 Tax=Lachnellula suecica TaxID=602035 RepID=A0A8T9CDN5_9HELO|nr:hypothetical protein LSUE1_G001987 [Lachnellula suecica]
MSFGWSIGDVIAGLKVVWDVWEAVSDGPLNARFEASQFFDEFAHIVNRLEDWGKRKAACASDSRLAASNQQLREQCTLFLKRHMSLIQHANPNTKAIRQSRSTWLQRVTFSQNQIVSLYQQVSWPFERKEVEKLRGKLQFFLQLATYDVTAATHTVAINTHDAVQDIRDTFRTSNAELLSSNLKLVSSHLDLVSLITLNLKRVTYPLEPGPDTDDIDFAMLRQFEQALRPPQPLGALEGPSRRAGLPWSPRSYHDNAEYAAVSPAVTYNQAASPFDQNEIRGLISMRLDNMSMRIGRVDTMESIPESGARQRITSATQPLLNRLQDMRDQIGHAVGITNHPLNYSTTMILEPESALRQELEAWNNLEERIEREILHPGRLLTPTPATLPNPMPIPIPTRRPSTSAYPRPSPSDGWHGPPRSSPGSNGGGISSSPNLSGPSSHTRSLSASSASPSQSFRLDHYLPVHISYPMHVVNAVIHSISRFDDGDVHSITATTEDGTTEIRHSIDLRAASPTETSMKPFLDNAHVEKTQRYRTQFQGAHNLKITKCNRVSRFQSPPIYKFNNQKDFLEFQGLLLNKTVKHCVDVKYIKSTDDDAQCRQGTVRILLDPFNGCRYILYFRHSSNQKYGFVEWPVSIFKDPKEPGKKASTLRLESHDGKSLSLAKGLSRRNTQGSVATINSFESSSEPAFGRMQDRSTSKSVRGLVLEFYSSAECHEFWKEFRIKEVSFLPSPSDHGLGFNFTAELP